LLPAGAVAGWGLHPLESAAFSRRTPIADQVHRSRPRAADRQLRVKGSGLGPSGA
jgi:hypothetical protein